MRKRRSIALLGVILLLPALLQQVLAAESLIPVGRLVGLELQSGTVTVAAFEEDSCARAAGMQVGDRLLRIDRQTICCAEDVRVALARSGGSVQLTLQRGDRMEILRLEPAITPEGPKLGLYLKQGVSGIGTVTYYDPDTGMFAALGHGVSDSQGKLIELRRGSAYPARVVSVRRGVSGKPGQLMGTLTRQEPLGTLLRNTEQGVFGKAAIPLGAEAIPVGRTGSVHTGAATILSTVTGDTPREYTVEILKLYPASRQNGRNMLIHITDPALLEATGGIVQGMSGSPIIQDGKLVGAVTHVLVNDPSTGYGIFIENMLDAAA